MDNDIMHQQQLQRIKEIYFSTAERTRTVKAGETVLQQGEYNDCLFLVKKGRLSGFLHNPESNLTAKVFEVHEGAFFGVHSYFAKTWESSTTIIADSDSELAWVNKTTQAVEPNVYGSLSEQFTPVVVHELAQRQMRTGLQALEKERALQKLHAAEQMTTLGQLAAGIAHELNNAVGVLSSKTETLAEALRQLVDESHPEANGFLELGVAVGQSSSSSEVRKRAKQLLESYKLDRDTAKQLAKAVPEGEVSREWFNDIEQSLHFWEMGRDLHDMRLASKHAASIVRSVKQLGGGDQAKQPDLDVNDTIHKSLALLQSNLRRVNVVLRPAVLPKINASATELVQVWVNIIKNACDAMEHVAEPQLEIVTSYYKNRLVVSISNNGPAIDEQTRRKVFQPNFTTKKGGLSFGLGLGLSIVQRIVHSYGGSIALKSDAEKTKFRIKLPIA
ncbi:ATP-binding protein [Aliagarivorans marinus]|uniref:ATP-binding protein n=1 Tax=Aliagarivorans marinus TaxID=561965 RepID=UPI000419FAB4|nr:ATP-binding protein [Aliagarivorans marinus]